MWVLRGHSRCFTSAPGGCGRQDVETLTPRYRGRTVPAFGKGEGFVLSLQSNYKVLPVVEDRQQCWKWCLKWALGHCGVPSKRCQEPRGRPVPLLLLAAGPCPVPRTGVCWRLGCEVSQRMFSAQCKSSEVLHKLHSFFCQNSSLAEIAFSYFFFIKLCPELALETW